MRWLAIETAKDAFKWILLEDVDGSPSVVENSVAKPPPGNEAQELRWFLKETVELVRRGSVDRIVLRPAEAGPNMNGAFLLRARVDAAILLAANEVQCEITSVHARTISTAFGVAKLADAAEVALARIQGKLPKSFAGVLAAGLTK